MSKATYSLTLLIAASCLSASDGPVGLFDGHEDVGTVLHAGSVVFDGSSYTVTGSGENMWSTADAFQFVWKKMSGDVMLTADISFPTKTGDEHKKAVLMIRQSLDAGSAYGDAVLHGNGLTSLQSRDQAGVATHEIQANVTGPRRLRIEKHGEYLYMSVGDDLHFSGGSMRVALEGSFYVGIGVCAHNKDTEEQAIFSNVELTEAPKGGRRYSTIETITVSSTDRRVATVLPELLFAPTWSRDGAIYFERGDGDIARIPVEGGEPKPIRTGKGFPAGFGISPDGRLLAFGDKAGIAIVPVEGGKARRIVKKPSNFEGWWQDAIVFTRDCRLEDPMHIVPCIYTAPAAGGKEKHVWGGALERDDHPEYSPDGKYLYFDSTRYFDFHYPSSPQIWRVLADGSGLEQLTADSMWNLYPHISPDGRRMVFLSYEERRDYPGDRDVVLRMMSLVDKKITVLAKLRGSENSLGSSPWSPDGRRVVLVSYQLRP